MIGPAARSAEPVLLRRAMLHGSPAIRTMQPGSGSPAVVSGSAWALRSQGSGNESQAAGQETQHEEGIEQRCWLKVQMQVGHDAGQNDKSSYRSQRPAQD